MHGADDEGFMFVSIEGIETDITFIDGVLEPLRYIIHKISDNIM